jgi:hypothetical protein
MGPAIYKIFHNHKEKVGEFPIPPHSQITKILQQYRMITKNKFVRYLFVTYLLKFDAPNKISPQYKLRVCKGCVTSLHDVI